MHPYELGTEQIIRIDPFRYQKNAAGRKCDGTKSKFEEPERDLLLLAGFMCPGNAAVCDKADAAIDMPDAFGNLGSRIQQSDAS